MMPARGISKSSNSPSFYVTVVDPTGAEGQ
jgi:hypothetical protein